MLKANRCLKQLRQIDRKSNKYLDIRLKDLIDNLREYEVNAREVMGCDFDDYIWDDVEPTAEVEEVDGYNSCGNTYNWNSDIVVNWFTYKINGCNYLAVKFHISGDVRGNYTDTMLLDMTLDQFFEVLADSTQVYFSIPVGRKHFVSFSTDALKEGNVFDIEVSDIEGNEVASEYDKYVSDIDTSERNRRELAKQIRALFRKDGELYELIA